MKIINNAVKFIDRHFLKLICVALFLGIAFSVYRVRHMDSVSVQQTGRWVARDGEHHYSVFMKTKEDYTEDELKRLLEEGLRSILVEKD